MKKSIRHLAVDILTQVATSKAFAGQLLDNYLSAYNLSSTADGRLLTHLVYGVLRFQGHLDWILAKLCRGNFSKIDMNIKHNLRVGLFQIKFSNRLPAFAVVDETVKVAKIINPASSGLVNAVLRNYLRRARHIDFPSESKNPAQYIAAFYSHPLWLVKNWIKTFGINKTKLLCTANNEIPPLTIRVNTQKISRHELQEKLTSEGFQPTATSYSPDGLIINNSALPVQKTIFFNNGFLRLQDEASQLISYLVNPQSLESIMDVCAGTGGKSTHLAAMQKNIGRILAVDHDLRKIEDLLKDAARMGISIIETKQLNLMDDLPELLIGKFDHVLVDVPCSGLGTLRRNPEIKWRTTPSDIIKFQQIQNNILQNASLAVRKGGRLIYCTCSLLKLENEDVIVNFLRSNRHFTLQAQTAGVTFPLTDQHGYFHTYPHLHNTDGFFGAILKYN